MYFLPQQIFEKAEKKREGEVLRGFSTGAGHCFLCFA